MRHERKIFPATVIMCILSVTLYLNVYHMPFQLELLQIELNRQSTSRKIIDILNFENEHGDLEEYMVELDEQKQDLERALPTQLKQGEFISYLQLTALNKNVELKSLTPEMSVLDEKFPVIRLPLKLQVECTYVSLLDFLKALEESERLIDIENFTVTSVDDGERLNCELEIILFATAKEGDV